MSDPTTLRSRAAAWYNETWTLIAKADRTPNETLNMLALAQASFSAWMAVPDHTPTHEAIGAWQVSRVHSVAGEGRLAEAWAHRSLNAAADADPFYRAYAREALARAYKTQGRASEVAAEVGRARDALKGTQEDELDALETDLAELESNPGSKRLFSISLHKPKPEYVGHLVDSMHRYGAAARTQPGLISAHTLRAYDGKTYMGLAVWASAEAKQAANPALGEAVANDDFGLWEETEIQGWGLESV